MRAWLVGTVLLIGSAIALAEPEEVFWCKKIMTRIREIHGNPCVFFHVFLFCRDFLWELSVKKAEVVKDFGKTCLFKSG